MNITASTFFIPCNNTQASAALYALNLIKRCSYNSVLQKELASRPSGLYTKIFQVALSGMESASPKHCLQFNFTGKYISSETTEGLLLSFFGNNVCGGLYSFHQAAALTFCQALLKCFDGSNDVEISHFEKKDSNYVLVGAVNASRDDFEVLANYPHLVFSPQQLEDEPKNEVRDNVLQDFNQSEVRIQLQHLSHH